jgi:GntR family transcriptional regulator
MSRNIPLYIKVQDQLLSKIQGGIYELGDQLPSEAELAEELGVSLITVRRAMQELSSEGWVIRQPGRGTFASKPTKIDQSVSHLTSFTTDMHELGINPSSTVVKQVVVPAEANLANLFKVKLGTELFHLVRIRKGNDIPILLESVYIPLALCPELRDVDFTSVSLYQVLTDHGVELTRSTQEFEPIVISDEQAKLLQVPAGTPVFMRQALSFHNDILVEWVESIYRKDRFRFIVETGKYAPKLVIGNKNNGIGRDKIV